MSKQRFRVGDVVNWNPEHCNKNSHQVHEITGPFIVIRSGSGRETNFVVSVVRYSDDFEPTHSGTGPDGEPAPYGGNNWDQGFFKLDPYLTAVYARKRVRGLTQRKPNLGTKLPKLPKKRRK